MDCPIQALKKTESTTKNKCSILLSSLYTELVFNTTLQKSNVAKSLKEILKKNYDNFLNYVAVIY